MLCIHKLFEAQAALTPDAVALHSGTERLSYRELDLRADAMARHLRAIGVRPGVLVALLLERSPAMIVSMLGILKAGGAYVPLDPVLPANRLEYMLADAKPLVVLTQKRLQAKLPPHEAQLVLVDEMAKPPQAGPTNRAAEADDLAYVIYTSGSTGQPKGVQIEHRAVANLLASTRRRPGFTEADRMLALTTIAFDISVLEIFLPLTCGGAVILASDETVRNGAMLMRLIEQSGVTVMQATPATFQMLLDAGWSGDRELKLLCGGEALSATLAAQLLPRCASLWNMYGPTETTVWSAVAKIEEGQPVVVGRPIARTRFYVLDSSFQLVPLGVPGELYIGGAGLARGYLNRPELTAEKFVTDPFAADGSLIYRTGDLVKRLPGGPLEFLGRIDHQVKIRGHRIELGEIESVLALHPHVAQSLAIAYAGADGLQSLAAYVIPAAGKQVRAQELRSFLASRLPSYMIPAAFVGITEFPLTASGKIDRKALPRPVLTPQAGEDFVAPATAVEKALAAVWQDMLNLKQVGLHDNFFNLGGHSLLALRTINEINKTLDVRLNVPDFFQTPTIGGLAAALAQAGERQTARVVRLQHGGGGLPVYFIGARPDEYRLAELIDRDRTVFLIDALMPAEWISAVATEDMKVLPSMEEIGELYGRALFNHTGTQPCVIAGYSLGGKIAFEAAQTLHRAGGKAAFVLLVDARAFAWNRASRAATVWRSLLIGLRSVLQPDNKLSLGQRAAKAGANLWRFARWQARALPAFIEYRREIAEHRRQATAEAAVPVEQPSGYFDSNNRPIGMFVVHRLAKLVGAAWRPRPIDTAGALIRAKAAVDMLPGFDRAHGWQPLFRGGFEIVQAGGDHVSILTEAHAETLSEQMNALLDRHGVMPAKAASGGGERRQPISSARNPPAELEVFARLAERR